MQKLAGCSLLCRLNGYVIVTVLLLALPEWDFGLSTNLLKSKAKQIIFLALHDICKTVAAISFVRFFVQ